MFRTFKQRLAENELTPLFALGRIPHPVLIDMFALAGGYAGFWLDGEHVALTTEQIINASIAARANNFDTFVRIPPIGYWTVTQCLEAGAGGVMAAQIHTTEQAREFVSWCKFSPQGVRGLNTGGRDGRYSHNPPANFVVESNRDNFVGIQIETLGSIEDANEIAALPGVDMLFIGPADLSLALGVVGEFHSDKLWEAIDRVAKACRDHGKAWGCVAPDAAFADRAVESGCLMPTLGNDVITMRRGIEALQAAFGNHLENQP
jgi:2-keto-3-deoxy-L-rhamnonate aldolase RhmA